MIRLFTEFHQKDGYTLNYLTQVIWARLRAYLLLSIGRSTAGLEQRECTCARNAGPGRRSASRGDSGVLQSVTDDSLVLKSGAGLETLSLTQIKRISVKEKRHRGRNALVGLGLGAGIGLLLGAVGDAKCGTGCIVPKHFGIEALPPLFGGVGALVGTVIPSGGSPEIYKQ